ncbi:cuticle protein AMP4 [Penaeus vannamei]|uniref:cuticle protein AMP4 n=1 Tax=Penaeus vannamei TaxID=6689 RepID=UPI000F667BBD|nr:cuticle protein AMP4-like [Penaeus vannamei]
MKLILVACLLAVAAAAPRPQQDAQLLSETSENQGDGNFAYSYSIDNGINVDAAGSPGTAGQSNIVGSYTVPLADGGFAVIRYIANEDGFQPESEILR